MPDDVVVDETLPESPFDIVEEGAAPVEEGPSKEELQAKFLETQKELEALKAQSAQRSGFESVVERLDKMAERPIQVQAPPAQQPGETDADFMERFNRMYLDNPSQALDEWANRKLGRAFETMVKGQEKLSRALALSDPENKKLYERYGKEVESEIERIPLAERASDPDVYRRAFSSVKGRHMDDYIAERVKEELAKLQAAQPQVQVAPTAPVGMVDRGSPLAAQAPKPGAKPRITASQAANIKAMMRSRGVPEERFEQTVLDIIEDGELSYY